MRVAPVALVMISLGFSWSAAAQNPEPGKAATAPQGGPRKDPKGIKGISPFWESIKKGDDAIASRDLDAAKAAYQEAIRSEPQNAMGHYRLGELELLKGSFPDAEAAWQAALRFVGQNASLKAKILFVLADVKERQRSWEEETNGWNAYEAHAKAAPTAKTYPQTPPDRKKRITDWKQLEIDYGAVKDRIKLRLEEANKKAAEDAQSPKNR
jgi:tetratricopeptide (TPR) repeat protein